MLQRGIDASKDQSYFLFATTPDQLDYLRFPLGGMTKEETRDHARRMGLSLADKPDSQDICFVPNGRYGDMWCGGFVPEPLNRGISVDLDGNMLGQHNGVIDFTIGQRRGLGIGGRKDSDESEGRLYVVGDSCRKHGRWWSARNQTLPVMKWNCSDTNWLADDISPTGAKGWCWHDCGTRHRLFIEPAEIIGWDEWRQARHGSGSMCHNTALRPGRRQQSMMGKMQTGFLGGGWISAAPTAAHQTADL